MKSQVLRNRLRDGCGGRVVFVSHCVLNENVRYPGGAARQGSPFVEHDLIAELSGRPLGPLGLP